MKNKKTLRLVFAAVCLALALILPEIIVQIPEIGKRLSPMHIPVFLAGFLCGPTWGGIVGFIAPLLRSLLRGMPAFPSDAIPMAFELLTYGFTSGAMNRILSKKPAFVWVSLVISMISGRIVWGIVKWITMSALGMQFTWKLFMAGAFINAIPGIIAHLVIVPIVVIALRRARITAE